MSQVSLPDLELQKVVRHFCLHTFLSRIFYLNYQIIIMYVWLQIRPLTVLDMYYWFKNYFKLSGLKQHTLFPFLWDKVEPWVFWDFCIGSQGVTETWLGKTRFWAHSGCIYLLSFVPHHHHPMAIYWQVPAYSQSQHPSISPKLEPLDPFLKLQSYIFQFLEPKLTRGRNH